ncbi:MAG: class I SAM-dependent rRNA methyltransferase [Candidatus Rokuibacteriota bacterium]
MVLRLQAPPGAGPEPAPAADGRRAPQEVALSRRDRAVLRLKRGRDARVRSHPWIFKGDVADVGPVEPGAAVTVVDGGGRFVGRGLYNPRPALCCRLLTWEDEPVDDAFWRRRIDAALARRGGTTAEAAGRLVWSEADRLPGLVVDRYGPALVVQCLTLGMAGARPAIVAALRARLGGVPVLTADDPAAAAQEGFVPERGWLDALGPAAIVVREGSVRLRVTLPGGQKTGLYLDQTENRVRAGSLAAGRDVLDVFAYSGGFACHALAGAARRAICVESSPDAVAAARQNFAENDVADRAEVRAVNAFDELRRLDRARERFGLIVLDPPPFARGRTTLEGALRGYKEINLRSMRLLAPGGRLMTFSCSFHVSPDAFTGVCREAAADARVTLRVLDTLGQAADHPVLLTVPETRYLKGLLLEVV